jgi:small acid-soluble spore protein H (minor)
VLLLDSSRVKQIIEAPEKIEVLYDGTPVWLENVNNNNTVYVTYIETHKQEDVPVYKLVEVNPVKH